MLFHGAFVFDWVDMAIPQKVRETSWGEKKSNKDFWSNVLYLSVLKIKLLILLTLKSDNVFNLLHVKIIYRLLTLIDNFGHFIIGQNLKSVATLSSIITSKSVELDFIYW